MDKYKKRINKVWNILNGRLPGGYCTPIKAYNTIYSLLRAQAKDSNCTYRELIEYYEAHLKKQELNKSGYISTKYYTESKSNKNKKGSFRITALASSPVKISKDNTLDLSNSNLAFLLLHEFNHIITNHEATEKQCDQFAIRWSRKLIKEGLI